MIVPANRYLLAVLNSKLADYYIRNLGVTRNGGYFEYKPMFIEKLPVPIINYSDEICQKIDKMLEFTNYIGVDHVVYQIYGLSIDEINYIESL